MDLSVVKASPSLHKSPPSPAKSAKESCDSLAPADPPHSSPSPNLWSIKQEESDALSPPSTSVRHSGGSTASSSRKRSRSRSSTSHEELKFEESDDDEVFEDSPLEPSQIKEEKSAFPSHIFKPYERSPKRRHSVPAPLLLQPPQSEMPQLPSSFPHAFPSLFSPGFSLSAHHLPILDPRSPHTPPQSEIPQLP